MRACSDHMDREFVDEALTHRSMKQQLMNQSQSERAKRICS